MHPMPARAYRFGAFRLDIDKREPGHPWSRLALGFAAEPLGGGTLAVPSRLLRVRSELDVDVGAEDEAVAGGLDRAVQSIFEYGPRRQLRQVLGDVDAARIEVQVLDGLASCRRTG